MSFWDSCRSARPDKAQQYIMDTTRTHQEAVTRIMNQIHEPSVAALLVGKTSRANELGIRLTLDQDSVLREESPWLPPNAYVTVLGNLIENAIEGLNQSLRGTKQITVSIREDESGLLLCVEDTGPGIPADLRRRLFQRGATSKGEGRGTGLSLVQRLSRPTMAPSGWSLMPGWEHPFSFIFVGKIFPMPRRNSIVSGRNR